SVSRSCRGDEDFAGSDSASDHILRVDWEETDSSKQGTSRSRRKSAASRALQGDHVSDSARCVERRGRRRGGELWTGTALGSDGAEFAMAPGRWCRRHQTLHGSSTPLPPPQRSARVFRSRYWSMKAVPAARRLFRGRSK